MQNFLWRVGDGFIPEPYRSRLYKSWFKRPLWASRPSHANGTAGAVVDLNYWTVIHFLSGVVFFLLFRLLFRRDASAWSWFGVHTAWEMYQVAIGMSDIFSDPATEFLDIGFDTLFAMLGFFTARLII
jgi:hypothetical protein